MIELDGTTVYACNGAPRRARNDADASSNKWLCDPSPRSRLAERFVK
jgi:hypothetical protein